MFDRSRTLMTASAAADIAAASGNEPAPAAQGSSEEKAKRKPPTLPEEADAVVRSFLAAARSEALRGGHEHSGLVPWSAWSDDAGESAFAARPAELMAAVETTLTELGYETDVEPSEDGWTVSVRW